jgi:hypothetical protein
MPHPDFVNVSSSAAVEDPPRGAFGSPEEFPVQARRRDRRHE